MRSIGKGIRRKTETAGKDTACLEFHSRPGERIKGEKENEENARERKERVSTSFQTYLRSVKYTVKNIRF